MSIFMLAPGTEPQPFIHAFLVFTPFDVSSVARNAPDDIKGILAWLMWL